MRDEFKMSKKGEREMKKGVCVGVSLVFLLVLVIGVASAAPKIAFMLPNVGAWYNDKWEGFRDEATKKFGFEVTMYSAGGYANVTKQVAQLEDVIKAGYDGIKDISRNFSRQTGYERLHL